MISLSSYSSNCDSQKGHHLTPGSNVKEDVKCYFSQIRKTTHETVERSEKSIVSTICSGKLFYRESEKRQPQETPQNRRKRWWKRPSPHRRRRDNEHEKPAALDIEDQHDDSEWISF